MILNNNFNSNKKHLKRPWRLFRQKSRDVDFKQSLIVVQNVIHTTVSNSNFIILPLHVHSQHLF